MAYVTLSVIVDGALERETNYFDETLLHENMRDEIRDQKDHGYPTEIYYLWHDHAPVSDCNCMEYAQDHNPYWTSQDGYRV